MCAYAYNVRSVCVCADWTQALVLLCSHIAFCLIFVFLLLMWVNIISVEISTKVLTIVSCLVTRSFFFFFFAGSILLLYAVTCSARDFIYASFHNKQIRWNLLSCCHSFNLIESLPLFIGKLWNAIVCLAPLPSLRVWCWFNPTRCSNPSTKPFKSFCGARVFPHFSSQAFFHIKLLRMPKYY